MEKFRANIPEPKKFTLRAVSELRAGDEIFENSVLTRIKAIRPSAGGITIELESGGCMSADDGREEFEVPA